MSSIYYEKGILIPCDPLIDKYLVKRYDIELRYLTSPSWFYKFCRKHKITHYCYQWDCPGGSFYVGRSSDNEWKKKNPIFGDRLSRECRAIPGFPDTKQPVAEVEVRDDGTINITYGVSGQTNDFHEKLQKHPMGQGRPKDQWKVTLFDHSHPEILKHTQKTQLQIMKSLENKYIAIYDPAANIIQANLNVAQTEKRIELFDEEE